MIRHLAIGVALALLLTLVGATTVSADEPPTRPNIVVFYIDDTSPHDSSLWNDPARTPSVYDNFIAHGLDFEHAIGETPLCCPARANLLTGLHTHNTRVTANEAALFDPSVHIGKSMLGAGYASMFIGKYLNRNNALTPEQWAEHDAGWSVLDVIKGANGDFIGYTLHTKTGDIAVKGLHSTQMVADRAIQHFRETPADTPIFAVLSIYNMHAPNTPMRQFVGDPRCAAMPPWNPPNYNEADVSDKPPILQGFPLLPDPDGWPMVRYCEEMLGVDKAVGEVIAELQAEGRLDNTLLVFTADNGMAWGQHRIGQRKIWPYTTPVPLYMRWPAAHWGDTAQSMSDVVSNIDLAPTFCELAQSCVLGPYSRGTSSPDGKSLVSMIDSTVAGTPTPVDRDAVLEENFSSFNSWSGLRTTALFDAEDRWHYVEYADGFVELYDLVADPWELQNVAGLAQNASLVGTLHDRLNELRLEGITAGTGSITIVEDARPDSGNDYAFTGDLGSFTLDDDGDTDSAYANQQSFADLPSGMYRITRTDASPPWMPVGADCDGVAATDPNGTMTIYLHPGEDVTCTWVDSVRRPDASIALSKTGTYKLDNFYSSSVVKQQTQRRTGVSIGRTYAYWLKIQNDSLATDTFVVDADVFGPATVGVKFMYDGDDVTDDVLSGSFTPAVSTGRSVLIRMLVAVGAGTPRNSPHRVIVRASSELDSTKIDVVRAVTVR